MNVKSRRDEYAEATRAALVQAARPLFAAHGYAHTSVDEIARAARVTKGALYHHFGGKQELFEAVLETLHGEAMQRVAERALAEPTLWDQLETGFGAFLDECLDPEFQRIVLQEGPAILGWTRWREIDESYAMGMLRTDLARLIEDGTIAPQPVDLLARLLLGAVTEAAMTIASASDATLARADAGALLLRLLRSLR